MLDSIDTLIAFGLIMAVVSLLITILVQTVSALLNLRGQNLSRGLTETFRTIAPVTFKTASANQAEEGKKLARALADHLLKVPQLSDQAGFWKMATAVRPQEVFATLAKIAQEKSDDESVRANAEKLLKELGFSGVGDSAKQMNNALTDVENALRQSGVPVSDTLAADLAATRNFITNAFVTGTRDTAASATEAWKKFRFWFESTQDRAQQWFATQTRICTIAFSIVAACFFQLDTVEIYKTVSTDNTIREKLVASAGAFTADAEKMLADSSTVLQETFQDWLSSINDANVRQSYGKLAPLSSDTRLSYLAKLHEALLPDHSDLENSFVAKLDSHVEDRLKKTGDFNKVRAVLEDTGFQLLPASFYRWPSSSTMSKISNGLFGNFYDAWSVYSSGICTHLIGILISAALLSLGAPFWFNILKSLVSLRSLVADNITKEQKSSSDASSNPDANITQASTTGLPPL
jgi:hypothetical protein